LWQAGQVQWREVPLPEGSYRVMEAGKVVASGD